MMKIGKEIKTNDFKNYNVIFGSVNNNHPKAIYIEISSWVEPKQNNEIIYTRIIKNLNKQIKQSLYNHISNTNTNISVNKTIVDLDIRESGIRFGKRSFMNCEMTFFLEDEIPMNSETMKNIMYNISNVIISKVLEPNKEFKFNKRKK